MRTRCPTAPRSDRTARMTRSSRALVAMTLALASCALLSGALGVAAGATPAGAEEPAARSTTTVPTSPQVPILRIIPLPNTGHAPRDADDVRGSGQYLVLLCILVGVGVCGLLVVREGRRAK